MTTWRRTTSDTGQATRAEAVRARRKQRDTQRPIPAVRTVSQLRAAVEQAAPTAVRTPRRISNPRASKRTSRWNVAVPRSGGLRAVALSLPHVQMSWRMASLAVVMVLSSFLIHTFMSPDYFITAINLAGARYVPGEEIYNASGVDYLSIFWLDPAQIKKNVEAVPGIQSATVDVVWPSNVYIELVEDEPVLAWSQGGQTMWVGLDGAVFPTRGEAADLVPIMADDGSNPLTTESRIPAPVIEGALQLKQLRSNIELLHYDSVNGLSYQDGRNWRGYFGAGTDMEVKLAVYETLVANLMARGIHPSIINVVNKDAPYYRR